MAIDLASRNPSVVGINPYLARLFNFPVSLHIQIHALILENTFLSLPRLIPTAMPMLARVAFLCHQKWDSASKIPLIPQNTPILMMSGVKDEVVPRAHMIELERLLRGGDVNRRRRPGWFAEYRDGAHSELDMFYVSSSNSRFLKLIRL